MTLHPTLQLAPSTTMVMMVAAVSCLLLQLAPQAATATSSVHMLNGTSLTDIDATGNLPNPWLVLFTNPENPASASERKAFYQAAALVPTGVAEFGIYHAANAEDSMVADAMGVRTYPSIRLMHTRGSRPHGPRGPHHGRVIFMPLEIPASIAADRLADFVITSAPMRYFHPITNQAVPSISYIFGFNELVEKVPEVLPRRLIPDPQHKSFVAPFGDAPKGVLFYFDLLKKAHLGTHAELASLGAKLGPRVVLFATEDEQTAKRFGLTEQFSAAAFDMREIDAVSDPVKNLKTVPVLATLPGGELATSGAATDFVLQYAAMPEAEYKDKVSAELSKWSKDVASFMNKSPFRKIDTTAAFQSDVIRQKATITILFILRESDQFFPRYHQTGIAFAKYLRNPAEVNAKYAALMNPSVNFETFWIDGEVNREFSEQIKVTRVPSVYFTLHTQDGKMAFKPFELPPAVIKKRKTKGADSWPDPEDIMRYITSEELYKGSQSMVAVTDPDRTLKLADGAAANADDTPKMSNKFASDNNNKYLHIDRKLYVTEEEKESTFLTDLALDKLQIDPDHYEKRSEEQQRARDEAKGVKAKPKLSKKEAARLKKLEEEMEKKRLAKEERTRLKKEADEKVRVELALKTKAKVAEAAKKTAAKGSANSVGGDGGVELDGADMPKIDPSKGPKNYHKQNKAWEADTRKMVGSYVKNTKEGIRVGFGLTAPKW